MNRKVLLIEDNAQNRYLVEFLLSSRGFHVIHACDGRVGLALAQQEEPVLILLDIQLPGMNGYEVAQALRAQPRFDAVPIVAVTSYAMPGDRERCIASGCNGYMEKPIDPQTFADSVEGFLAQPQEQPR